MCKQLLALLLFLPLTLLAAEPDKSELLQRDPTKPLNFQAAAQSQQVKLVLSSILISGARKQAIINGQSLIEGQRLAASQFTLVAIAADRIALSDGKNRRTLYLAPQVVKTKKTTGE